MVKLEEVEEDTYPEQPNTFNPEEEEGWDTDDASESSLSDYDEKEGDDLQESFTERVAALKEIIPPSSRRTLSSVSSSTYNWGTWGVTGGLKLAWQVSTSVLLLVVPFSLVMMEDQAIAAEEQQMKMREAGGEMMTQQQAGEQGGQS